MIAIKRENVEGVQLRFIVMRFLGLLCSKKPRL
jgi:hypothetical protein